MAAYLEAFILVGVAIGGSALVFGSAMGLVSQHGPGISVTDAAIRQGGQFALESLLVSDTGDTPLGSFVVSTGGVSAGASYCYTLYDPLTRSVVSSTCPVMAAGPGSVKVSAAVPPGRAVLLVMTLAGEAFQPGSVSRLTVTASGGAQQGLDVEVVPA